ncbi:MULTISPECIES: hypothetical protein [Vibrio]|jgi:hypothetical protein|uniref:Uncharacterized protein n=1 Tax=Vibrio jasicida TaxID=766224 RepID=A0AAU9QQA7_9VIBR|nr:MULTISPECIES: hypothetical protein [Vibrio]KIP76750.1 hypothetical protein SN10_04165 [Vibrio harveyi]KIP78538.1 hypothetical protein SN11_06775 [Vibrio harveyi]MCF6450580.1 hypothetical protein [Vibrio sp. MMG023]MCX2789775.1 hypothetical protein [Vibrio sp. Sgm 5]NOJ19254.1 hypothetical protein [Vibrio jasicida]
MVRIVVFSACTLLVVTQASFACNYLSDRSVVFADNTMPICEDIFDSVGVLSVDTLNWYEAEERPLDEPTENYWDEWAIKSEDTPLLTQSLESNYFGLGVWMPEELRDDESKMTTEEWLKSHGLMFSIGFGDKSDGEPRMRFDYRWHEYYDADWMMQIEVPF